MKRYCDYEYLTTQWDSALHLTAKFQPFRLAVFDYQPGGACDNPYVASDDHLVLLGYFVVIDSTVGQTTMNVSIQMPRTTNTNVFDNKNQAALIDLSSDKIKAAGQLVYHHEFSDLDADVRFTLGNTQFNYYEFIQMTDPAQAQSPDPQASENFGFVPLR